MRARPYKKKPLIERFAKAFLPIHRRSAVDEVEKAKIRVFYVAINNRRYDIKGKSALQPTIYRTAVFFTAPF